MLIEEPSKVESLIEDLWLHSEVDDHFSNDRNVSSKHCCCRICFQVLALVFHLLLLSPLLASSLLLYQLVSISVNE